MRIGVDATCWHNRRGYGRHARALLRALTRLDSSNQYTLFLDSTEAAEPMPEECEVRMLKPATPTVLAASANGHRSAADMWRMSRALSAAEFDMLLFPTIYSYVPIFGRARKLVMVHDVIAETYPQLTVPRLPARLFWNIKVALGRMQADALITVSDYSREGFSSVFGIDPDACLWWERRPIRSFASSIRGPRPKRSHCGSPASIHLPGWSSTWAASARTRIWKRW